MCGVFGVIGHKDAGRLVYLGLYALQHRGEESAGIVTYHKKRVAYHKGMGLVGDVFDEKALKSLPGDIALGHVRYSTTGASHAKNIQPFLAKHRQDNIVVAHNGNLTNIGKLHCQLEERGSIFQTTMDSEVVTHLIAAAGGISFKDKVMAALGQLEGAYSFILMYNDMLVAARDPYGFRPLCLGRLGEAYILASETCALDLIGAQYLRDIEPGEVVFIHQNKLESLRCPAADRHSLCIFEYIYFARPDSNIFTKNVYRTRKNLGCQLAREYPLAGDLVMPIPDSGSCAALGFAQEADIPYEIGMIRNHYIGRTFIQPSQLIRDFRVRVKLNPVAELLKGKRVVVIEDSVVRGTTCRARVKTLRQAGAREIHMGVTCPPIRFPCFYGIDFPTKKELIASNYSVDKIKDFIGLDSLKYLSLDGMLSCMPLAKEEFCTACFTGRYPAKVPRCLSKNILEKRK